MTLVDPATGRRREVRITADVQRRFAEAAAGANDGRMWLLRRAGADVIELSTDGDWLGAIIGHVRQRRVQAVAATRGLARPAATATR